MRPWHSGRAGMNYLEKSLYLRREHGVHGYSRLLFSESDSSSWGKAIVKESGNYVIDEVEIQTKTKKVQGQRFRTDGEQRNIV